MTIKKNFKSVLFLTVGLLAGAFIRLGVQVSGIRISSAGGEIFILPLIALLIWLGYSIGKEIKFHLADFKSYEIGYSDGYVQGKKDGTHDKVYHPDCTHEIHVQDRTGQ